MKRDIKHLNTLGQRIKFFRQRMNMTQLELEHAAGLSVGTITRIENDIVEPTRNTIFSIADALGLNVKEAAYLLDINLYTKTYTSKSE